MIQARVTCVYYQGSIQVIAQDMIVEIFSSKHVRQTGGNPES